MLHTVIKVNAALTAIFLKKSFIIYVDSFQEIVDSRFTEMRTDMVQSN